MEKLGIQPTQLLSQIINILVMVFLLTKILYKPIIKVLDERKKKIQEGVEYTEKTKKELEQIEKKKQEILKKAESESKKIIEEGRITGKRLEAQIIEKAQREAKEIVEKGKKEIAMERFDLEKQLKTQTVEIASAMAEKILTNVLDKGDQKNIINRKYAQSLTDNQLEEILKIIGYHNHVNLHELKLGIQVELEHGSKNDKLDVTHDNLIKTAKIALAHLDELKDYYTKLKKMENS